jgi:hypothetical protein
LCSRGGCGTMGGTQGNPKPDRADGQPAHLDKRPLGRRTATPPDNGGSLPRVEDTKHAQVSLVVPSGLCPTPTGGSWPSFVLALFEDKANHAACATADCVAMGRKTCVACEQERRGNETAATFARERAAGLRSMVAPLISQVAEEKAELAAERAAADEERKAKLREARAAKDAEKQAKKARAAAMATALRKGKKAGPVVVVEDDTDEA